MMISEKNLVIATMLGAKANGIIINNDTFYVFPIDYFSSYDTTIGYPVHSMCFHSNWRWLMIVRDFIRKEGWFIEIHNETVKIVNTQTKIKTKKIIKYQDKQLIVNMFDAVYEFCIVYNKQER